MNTINVTNLSFRIPHMDSRHLFQNLTFSIEEGHTLLILGPSGCGKTTLLKLIAGLLQPSEGTVEIWDKNLSTISSQKKCSILKRIGFVFQRNALFDSLTVFENLALPVRLYSHDGDSLNSENEEDCYKLLDAVGLSDAKQKLPSALSGGMQKRLGLARALVLKPEILLLDDPTAGLDPITSRKIFDFIKTVGLQSQLKPITTLVVTPDLIRAHQFGGPVGILINERLEFFESLKSAENQGDQSVRAFLSGSMPLTNTPKGDYT